MPWSLPLGSLAWGQLAQGSSQRADQAAGSEFKANFASTARSSAPGAQQGRAGARCLEDSLQPCSPPVPRGPLPGPPAASPRSRRPPPGAERLPAGSGKPGSPHTYTCASASARPRTHERAPRARSPCLARTRQPGRSRDRRGSAICKAHCFPTALYLVACPGLGDQERGEWSLGDKPLPLPPLSPLATGGAGPTSWLNWSFLFYPLKLPNKLYAGERRAEELMQPRSLRVEA